MSGAASDTLFDLKNEEPYAIVFSGGGAFGAWEAGVLALLWQHHGRGPQVITGTSAGALNAVAVAAGIVPDELQEIWKSIRREHVYTPRITRAHAAELAIAGFAKAVGQYSLKFVKRTPELSFVGEIGDAFGRITSQISSILDCEPLEWTLKRILSNRWNQLSSSTKCLVLCATDAKMQERLYYCMGPPPVRPQPAWTPVSSLEALIDALMASTAIPLVFPSRRGRYDGGLTRNQPLSAAMAYDVPNIYIIIPGLPGVFPELGTTAIASSMLGFLTSASLGHQLDLARIENRVRRTSARLTLGSGRRQRTPCALKIIRPNNDLARKFAMNLLSFGHQRLGELIENGATFKELSISTPAI